MTSLSRAAFIFALIRKARRTAFLISLSLSGIRDSWKDIGKDLGIGWKIERSELELVPGKKLGGENVSIM